MKKVLLTVAMCLFTTSAFAVPMDTNMDHNYDFVWNADNVWAIKDMDTNQWYTNENSWTFSVDDTTGHYMNLVTAWDDYIPGDFFAWNINGETQTWDYTDVDNASYDHGYSYDTYFATGDYTLTMSITNKAYDWEIGRAHVYFSELTQNPSAPVPEPTTMLLFGTGMAGLVAARRKKLDK